MIEIIPAIDLIGGKCVRLSQGDYNQKTEYAADPLDMALQFEDAGVKRLHLVDLDGAKARKITNWKTLEKLCSKTKLQIDFGGGVNTENDLNIIFDSGASMATLGSIALKETGLVKTWIKQYGIEKIWIGADVKEEKLAINGWLDTSEVFVFDFIQSFSDIGFYHFFCTDIAKDGMMQGPSEDLYKKIIQTNEGVKLTASGGIRYFKDIEQLNTIGCVSAIVGKAIYEGGISLQAIRQYNLSKTNLAC
jgi:phosphoribosylformimino-5-aminoimidazole carboxamide ribotide isomerase